MAVRQFINDVMLLLKPYISIHPVTTMLMFQMYRLSNCDNTPNSVYLFFQSVFAGVSQITSVLSYFLT